MQLPSPSVPKASPGLVPGTMSPVRCSHRQTRGHRVHSGHGLLDRADDVGLGSVAEVQGHLVADRDEAFGVSAMTALGDLELDGGDPRVQELASDGRLHVGRAVRDVAVRLEQAVGQHPFALVAQGRQPAREEIDAGGGGGVVHDGA